MYISKLKIQNFRCFKDVEMQNTNKERGELHKSTLVDKGYIAQPSGV